MADKDFIDLVAAQDLENRVLEAAEVVATAQGSSSEEMDVWTADLQARTGINLDWEYTAGIAAVYVVDPINGIDEERLEKAISEQGQLVPLAKLSVRDQF